ncbi:MAG: VWA domain-containing protein [Kiritimatiellae bacterium]|nr:VWA domain-containing protein [Kiritimatiellia bacterium]
MPFASREPAVKESGIPADGRVITKRRLSTYVGVWGGRNAAVPPEPWEDIGLNDEVWVIETARAPAGAEPGGRPTQGELRAKMDDEEIPLPLKHTDVKAQVSAFIATVNVVQQYQNPYDVKIEAVYVFPLPESSAVTDFVMTIGERRIRGMVREREEAKRVYEAAKAQGYRAALLTQERPNVFTQKVANIEPGKRIDVEITYFNPLPYRDGEYQFIFPMVVGPRYNPAGATDGIGAVGRGRRGASGQATELEYLKPGERTGHDIAVEVKIDAGVEIESIHSTTHAVDVVRHGPGAVRVALKESDRIPNKDFVLAYKVAGKRLKTAMLVDRGKKGNTFALVLHPPEQLTAVPRMPREMVFVLDCSGSMSGHPIEKAKQAMRRCLRNLDANDTFQIIRFSDRASTWGRAPVPATRENVRKALRFVDGLAGSGGTEMIEGIKAALDFPHDEGRLRVVSFMTDGYIGNEAEILAAVRKRLGPARIFSFGVGNSVNRYLLERMASFGKGAVAYVGLDDSAGREVDRFYDRLAHPALTDVRIDWGGMRVSEVYPRVIPDVFVGRPVLITGRFEGGEQAAITVSGKTGAETQTFTLDAALAGAEAEHPGITGVWARWKIRELSNAEIAQPAAELKDEIVRTSVEYNLLSRYTAFLAVDSLDRTAGEHGVSVNVPVHVPDGVRYETTVQE